ncbi:hypothetical protein TIFTF001_033725 [Ficus carica]|uniref:Receptor-like serine/threonine-protein kinase n=1 Tax=Ficus carica TaxID=3494 RepID=A0AA88J450_FICCA|nr:hypothetical protein TIFTF001_033725 [Ficus carica]
MDHRASTIFRLVDRLLSCVFLIIIWSDCSCHLVCSNRDVITQRTPLRDNRETLVSAGGIFELGFFTPNGTSDGRRYVGIWYKFSPSTIVWVANRNNPLVDPSGVFSVRDGNLHVLNERTGSSLWSTDLGISRSANQTVMLLDSGNLVLIEGTEKGESLWESFQYPTDTFLPGMEIDANLTLTSWINKDDPGRGDFVFKVDDRERDIHFITMNKSIPYWKSGDKIPISDKIPDIVVNLLTKFNSATSNPNSTANKPFKKDDYNGSRLVITFDGYIQYHNWVKLQKSWQLIWWEPTDRCSIFNACGNFGSCNATNSLACKCLPGFKPSDPEKWNSGDFSGGCNRVTQCSKNDTFVTVKLMSAGKPDSEGYQTDDETECMKECLRSCPCKAYSLQAAKNTSLRRGDSSTSTRSCSIWLEDLRDLQEGYADGGLSLLVRVLSSDLEGNIQQPPEDRSPTKGTSFLVIIVSIVPCTSYLVNLESIRSDQRSKELLKLDTQKRINYLINSAEFEQEDGESIDVPFFDFESILAATDGFSDANKLGQGGYGPVYKGIFPGGQEIAMKRLSSASGQGLQEFKNEVVLIAKLQHRNLVRLRGYCVQGEEKILLYEYMPNKSLDSFIFDDKQSMLLDWEMRFNIILGIARGLLYLHQDSRLRIIHRDLKSSNILLDQDMEPKISDFGLARIVGGKQTEANTSRVVGTYGYMSPEYALEGLFSVKSDVFSFGVVLLEIISGKRNTRLVQSEQLSLLGYAWRLWTENKVLDLMDPSLQGSYKEDQYVKCFKVGLLCVQEDPSDRPTVPSIITMLDSETAAIPTPQQPAFVLRRGSAIASSSSSKPETIAEITATLEEGR